MLQQQSNKCNWSIFAIWKDYAIGSIAIAIVPALCAFIPLNALPVVLLGLSLGLFSYVRYCKVNHRGLCAIIPYLAGRAMLCFTFVSLVLSIVNIHADIVYQVHPITYIYALFWVVVYIMSRRKWHNTFCLGCILTNGTPQERMLLGHNNLHETDYLYRHLQKGAVLMLVTTIIPTILEIQLQRPFSATFSYLVYVWLPIFVVAIDVSYMRFRYSVIEKVANDSLPEKKIVRILLISDNSVFISKINGLTDTPFEFTEPWHKQNSLPSAGNFMRERLGILPRIYFCYGTSDELNHRGVEHFVAFVDNIKMFDIEGKWEEKKNIEKNFNKGFSPIFCTEIQRIYSVMMTSRLFNIDGTRKVNIPGYIPDFSLNEIETADVDFNDSRWMVLSRFNSNIRFHSLKMFWYKYIEGLS